MKGCIRAYRDHRVGRHYAALNTAQKKAVDNALRATSNSGIGLPKRNTALRRNCYRLSELGNRYSNNVLDATMGWTKLVTDEAGWQGCQKARWLRQKQAEAKELEGYLLTWISQATCRNDLHDNGACAKRCAYSLVPSKVEHR